MKSIFGIAIASLLIGSPAVAKVDLQPLSGVKILVNPGHGGQETGAIGATGDFAKDVSLTVSKLLREELQKRGAIVIMTREDDTELALSARQAMIAQHQPAIALTIHYTSVADDGDPQQNQGVRFFWYHPQAHSLAVFLHNHLVKQLARESKGVFWNNLALTRPTSAPSVVMELGFMSHPQEITWITNRDEQKKLARVLADGIVKWFADTTPILRNLD